MPAAISGLGELAAATPAARASPSAVSEAQERFLTLLVTQMRNQDPLNPLDNAQVTTQLAQLNTVAGINQLNETMQGMVAQLGAAQLLQGAALVGHHVMVPGSQVVLAEGQALFGAELAQDAERLSIEIIDAAGRVVHRAEAGAQPAGLVALHWDGALDAGGTAPDGRYRFVLSASAGGKAIEARALSVERVDSVTGASDGLRLNLALSGGVPLASVRQVF